MCLYEIDVKHSGGARVIELHGEFDLHGMRELSEALEGLPGSRNSTVVDLSGVTFADLLTLRKLSDALIYYPGLSLCSPSPQVLRSARLCNLEGPLGFDPASAGIAKASRPGPR